MAHVELTNKLFSFTRKLLSPVRHTQNFIELNGIVMILIDQLINFSFTFMFYLRQSADREYHKSKSMCVSSPCNIARITALKE